MLKFTCFRESCGRQFPFAAPDYFEHITYMFDSSTWAIDSIILIYRRL